MKRIAILAIAVGLWAEDKKPALTEIDQLWIENILLKLRALEKDKIALNTALAERLAERCKSLGGKSVTDCDLFQPDQTSPLYRIELKKVETKK